MWHFNFVLQQKAVESRKTFSYVCFGVRISEWETHEGHDIFPSICFSYLSLILLFTCFCLCFAVVRSIGCHSRFVICCLFIGKNRCMSSILDFIHYGMTNDAQKENMKCTYWNYLNTPKSNCIWFDLLDFYGRICSATHKIGWNRLTRKWPMKAKITKVCNELHKLKSFWRFSWLWTIFSPLFDQERATV